MSSQNLPIKQIFWICCLLLWGVKSFSQNIPQEALFITNQKQSKDRIKALCIFYDSQIHHRNPQKFDAVLTACLNFESKNRDPLFKAYINFYKEAHEVTLIPDKELLARKAKMLKIWNQVKAKYDAQGDLYFSTLSAAYISHIYFMRKEYANSLESWLITEENFRKVGMHKFPDMGKHLHNMGLVLYFFRDYKKAAELMEISIKLSPYSVNYHIQSYNTLGASYKHLKHLKKAERAFVKAIEISESYNIGIWVAIASRGLAEVWMNEGQIQKAENLLIASLTHLVPLKYIYPREYSEHLLSLMQTYLTLNEIEKGSRLLKQLNYKKVPTKVGKYSNFGDTYQDINYWVKYYEVLYLLYNKQNAYQDAYKYADSLYYMKYQVDSNFNTLEVELAQNRVEVQKKQFLSDKKEAIIQNKNQQMLFIGSLFIVITLATLLLIHKNRKIDKQNQTIQKQVDDLKTILNQKQVLLAELQHRVKNNLQHVINILEIQKESITHNNIEELIRSTQNRIHSMALLHKKLHVSEHTTDINLKRFTQELALLIQNSYEDLKKELEIHIDCQAESISLDKAVPLSLIMVELISNSIKHAFPKNNKGDIYMKFIPEKNGLSMQYADTGKGFDFHLNQNTGLGQDIIKGLIDQLNGTFETAKENGFAINIYFSKKTLEENGFQVIDAKNVEEALNYIKKESIDLCILDIHLGEDSPDGISLGQTLQEKYQIPFIYLTAYEQVNYIERALKTMPYSYLTKPYKNTDLVTSVNVAIKQSAHQEKYKAKILVKDEDFKINLAIQDINFLESQANYVLYHTDNMVYKSRSTLKQLLEILPESSFIQVHRAFIINKKKIEKTTTKNVIVAGVTIPISKGFRL